MDTALHFALEYARLGLAVFPCGHDKKPQMGVRWTNESTVDPEKIKTWAQQYPGTWWGCDCLKSGLAVIDEDIKNGVFLGEASLKDLEAREQQVLPQTYTVQTLSGGRHRYYRGQVKTSAGNLGPGLDVRSDGGYVIIPNDHYKVLTNGTPIQPIPAWFARAAGRRNEKSLHAGEVLNVASNNDVVSAVAWLSTDAPPCVEGSRDNTTFKVAATLRSDFGLSPDQILTLMRDVWLPRHDGQPGDWTESDLAAKINSACRNAQYGQGERHPTAVFDALPGSSLPTTAMPIPYHGQTLTFPTPRRLSEANVLSSPRRPWLMDRWYIQGYVTLTIAKGGAGKSCLTMVEALAVATGKPLTGRPVHKKGAVWVYNTEDPDHELDLRWGAACQQYSIDPTTLTNVHFTSGQTAPMEIASEHNRSIVVNEPFIQHCINYIKTNEIILFVVDPFVETHSVNENDNMAIAKVAQSFRRIAIETGCAVSLVHHINKGNNPAGDMDRARGASSLTGSARIVRTFTPFEESAAEDYVLHHSPECYVALDAAKGNMSPPGTDRDTFLKVSVILPCGESVGAVVPAALERREKTDGLDWLYEAVARAVHTEGDMSFSRLAKYILDRNTNKDLPGATKLARVIEEKFEHGYQWHETGKFYTISGMEYNGRPIRGIVERDE